MFVEVLSEVHPRYCFPESTLEPHQTCNKPLQWVVYTPPMPRHVTLPRTCLKYPSNGWVSERMNTYDCLARLIHDYDDHLTEHYNRYNRHDRYNPYHCQ